ncbi:receptor-like protein 7 [Coffea arabica]|uniref:Receptor-like protein 7 n=1 Tax=Coffea arabica TaxID=13443 RepID=A0A6P6SWT7_COFAR|nr:probable inactive leucine-rich repeat receptor-like protein kinase At1g66830 [Coffea arabica]
MALSYDLHSHIEQNKFLTGSNLIFKAAIKSNSIKPYSCLGSWNFSDDSYFIPRAYFSYGLLCSGNSVTQLTLNPADYAGTLTPLISKIAQLVTLDLSTNKFSGPIPPRYSLTNLQTLVLRFNSFSSIVPPSLTALKSLDTVDFSHNYLSGSLPNSWSSIGSLRRLDLSYNKLIGSLPKLPPNLIELAIKANYLSGPLYKTSFQGLTQLEVVELSENSFPGTLETWFFLLPTLQQVDLANYSFTWVDIWKPKNGNSNLVAVDLGFNRIEWYLSVNFAAYALLSFLSLRYNRFRGSIP